MVSCVIHSGNCLWCGVLSRSTWLYSATAYRQSRFSNDAISKVFTASVVRHFQIYDVNIHLLDKKFVYHYRTRALERKNRVLIEKRSCSNYLVVLRMIHACCKTFWINRKNFTKYARGIIIVEYVFPLVCLIISRTIRLNRNKFLNLKFFI